MAINDYTRLAFPLLREHLLNIDSLNVKSTYVHDTTCLLNRTGKFGTGYLCIASYFKGTTKYSNKI